MAGYCREATDADGGSGRGEKVQTVPVPNVKIVDIACGPEHTVALDDQCRVFTWGFGGYGRLGQKSADDVMTPQMLEIFERDNAVSGGACEIGAGGLCGFARTNTESKLYFWGQTKPTGEATMYPKPWYDLAPFLVSTVGVGAKHTVAMTEQGCISFGASPCYGELGYGEGVSRSSTVPKRVAGLDGVNIIATACGHSHTLMIADVSTPEEEAKLAELPYFGKQMPKGTKA